MLVNLCEMLADAKKNKYSVGLFNTVNIEMAKAVFNAAEELRAPVIVGTAEVLLPALDLKKLAGFLVPMAKDASVPVCVHFDHGLSFDKCMEAIDLGFSSIMYDCSTLGYEDNVSNLKKMVKICHDKGLSVEGELGHVGDTEGRGKLENPSDYFTDPAQALDFVTRTGIDALAIAVGNAHGEYKFPPKLDFERIEAISKLVNIPLVLHGGSGLSESDFKTAAQKGICKINIFTDIDKAGKAGIEEGLKNGASSMMQLMPYEIAAIEKVVKEKIILYGSNNRV